MQYSSVARIFANYPCLALFTAAALGQLAAESYLISLPSTTQSCTVLLLVFFIAFTLYRHKAWKILMSLLVGIGSSTWQGQPVNDFVAHAQFVEGRVTNLRFPKPGAATFMLLLRKGRAVQCRAVHLPWRSSSALSEGVHVRAFVHLKALRVTYNPFQYERVLWRHGATATCKVQFLAVDAAPKQSIKDNIREQVEVAVGQGERSGMLLAMSLGFRDQISERTETAFRALGLSHLLVLSGYQVGLIFSVVYFAIGIFLRRCGGNFSTRVQRIMANGFSCGVLFIFLAIVGVESSSLRALIAALLFSLARVMEWRVKGMQLLAAALYVENILVPGSLFEPSLELTAAALYGFWLGDGSTPLHPWARLLRMSMCASFCAGLVAWIWFGAFSVVSPILNPVVAPLLSIIGCPIVLCAIALYCSGVDSYGLSLNAVASLFSVIAQFTVQLARSEFHSFLSNSAVTISAASICGVYCLMRTIRKVREECWQLGVYDLGIIRTRSDAPEHAARRQQ